MNSLRINVKSFILCHLWGTQHNIKGWYGRHNPLAQHKLHLLPNIWKQLQHNWFSSQISKAQSTWMKAVNVEGCRFQIQFKQNVQRIHKRATRIQVTPEAVLQNRWKFFSCSVVSEGSERKKKGNSQLTFQNLASWLRTF